MENRFQQKKVDYLKNSKLISERNIGVALTIESWKKLKDFLPEIEEAIENA